MTPTESQMLDAIRTITAEKITAHRFPTFALSVEVVRRIPNTSVAELRAVAERLSTVGLIHIGNTVNYECYELLNNATTH